MAEADTLVKKLKTIDWQTVLILLTAAVFRVLFLDNRPAHHDEGVNGWFADQITANGFYKYDPTNYHGPLHFYIIFLVQTLFGRSSFLLRLPTVMVSILSVYWILLFSKFIDKKAVQIAAICMAVSPAFVYFGRFAIHESDLVFFIILTMWGIIGLYKSGSVKYLWAVGLGIAGLLLTKETYIIHLAGFFLSLLSLKYFKKSSDKPENGPSKQYWSKNDLILVVGVCVGIILFFYSGAFLYSKGFTGIFETIQAWVSTGSKTSGHQKPILYWLNITTEYEIPVFIGIICSLWYLTSNIVPMRLITIYGLATFVAYSLVPYKTPWCSISIFWPFYIILGHAITRLMKTQYRFITKVLFVMALLHSVFSSIKLNFYNYTDHKIKYVYVQTFSTISKLIEPIMKLVKDDPSNYSMKGIVLRPDEWPVPWILGDFSNVGYHNLNNIPKEPDADFLFIDKGYINYIEENLKNEYFTDQFQLRDAQAPSKVYLSYEKFKDLFPDRTPEFKPTEHKQKEKLLPGQGLLGLFYNNSSWSNQPVLKKVFTSPDIYWEGNSPLPPPFSVELTGEINIQEDTLFSLSTDDGGFLEIDGERIIDDPGPHGVQTINAKVTGKKGWKKIRTGFYDTGGGAIIKLFKTDGTGKDIPILTKELRYDERLIDK